MARLAKVLGAHGFRAVKEDGYFVVMADPEGKPGGWGAGRKDEEHAEESAELHRRIFDMLMAEVLTGDDARRLITTTADRLRS
ncbi:MAG TPA: hypothetical protein VH589_23820 [Trebonia sp.]|jgi:hypothetical protein